MKIGMSLAALIIFFSLTAYAQTPPAPSQATRAEMAPTGTLRVGLILSNAVLVTKDPQSGELRGVTIDLGREIAARLGVPFEPVGYANPAKLAESFGSNAWDMAFIAIDPARAAVVDFSQPYMEVDNSYLVPAGSRIQSVADADQPSLRIAVPEKSVPDLYLSRTLKHAELVRIPGGLDAALETLKSGKADAYAENAHMLLGFAARLPGARVLDGHYTVVQHGIAVPKGRPAALAYIKDFIEQAKASGVIRQAIERAGLRRTQVPPRTQ